MKLKWNVQKYENKSIAVKVLYSGRWVKPLYRQAYSVEVQLFRRAYRNDYLVRFNFGTLKHRSWEFECPTLKDAVSEFKRQIRNMREL